MITGAHIVIYSRDAEADRAFFRDVLEFPFVDAGGGWLIFGLPPSEVAFHPGESDAHEFYLMSDDVISLVAKLRRMSLKCERVRRLSWGLLTRVRLPGGGRIGVYQPSHPRPPSPQSVGRRR